MRSWVSLPAIIAFLAVSPPSDAITLTVEARGYTSLNGGATQNPLEQSLVVSPNGSRQVTATGLDRTEDTGGPILSFAQGSANAFASAAPGQVRVRVDTGAVNRSFIPNVPFLSYLPVGTAGVQASSADFVTVTDPTLPIGTPIIMRAILEIEGFSNSPPRFQGEFSLFWVVGDSAGAVGANHVFPNGFFNFVPADLDVLSQTFELPVLVGQTIQAVVRLSASGFSRAGQDTLGNNYGAQNGTVIDVGNTVNLFLASDSPTTRFLGDEGHDYSPTASAPEPAIAVLSLLAVAGLSALRRRQRELPLQRPPV